MLVQVRVRQLRTICLTFRCSSIRFSCLRPFLTVVPFTKRVSRTALVKQSELIALTGLGRYLPLQKGIKNSLSFGVAYVREMKENR